MKEMRDARIISGSGGAAGTMRRSVMRNSIRLARAVVLGALIAFAPSLVLNSAGAQEEPASPQSPPDVEAIMKHFDELYRSESSIATVEFIVTKPRRTRKMRMKMWTRGEEKALIVIESPAREKGMSTLKVGKNLWNYLPRISRTIRIPPSMMLGSWMGSDFTNDDLVKESSFREDYTYELVGRSEDPPGWQVRLEARPGVVGLWKSIEWVVSDDGTLPIQAKYYDRKGRLSRTMRFDEVREFGGRRVPARMVLVPTDKEGHRTELRYLDIDFDVHVPESTFSLSRLERVR